MDEQQIRQIIQDEIYKTSINNLFDVSNIPAHAHTGIDSSQIDPKNLLGFPATSATSALTAPTDSPVNGTIRFYYDTTNYVEWVRINNTWVNINLLSAASSGTYTPTLTSVANVAASTAYACQYSRVGSVVTVSGKVDVDPTVGVSTTTQLGVSLPIASNFSAAEQLAGTASSPSIATQVGGVYADGTNDRAQLDFKAVDPNNTSWYFIFSYRVI